MIRGRTGSYLSRFLDVFLEDENARVKTAWDDWNSLCKIVDLRAPGTYTGRRIHEISNRKQRSEGKIEWMSHPYLQFEESTKFSMLKFI